MKEQSDSYHADRQLDFIPVYQRHGNPQIVATFKEIYDADVSPTLIPKVTDAVVKGQATK